MFYADFEGLRGSGLTIATRIAESEFTFASSSNKQRARSPYKNKAAVTRDYPGGTSARQGRLGKRPISRFNLETLEREVAAHKATASRRLELQWAATTSDPPYSGRVEYRTVVALGTRQIIVKDLYPRLLYTFSDVVCYVTNNPRATEAELLHLFERASSGHERTLNQRVRPVLLIVVNKDVPSASEDWLDVDHATETLLSHLEFSLAFADLRRTWQKRGKSLKTAEDLILCYCDSFRIICIPNLDQMTTHTIAVEYDKLYKEVRQAIEKMRVKRKVWEWI